MRNAALWLLIFLSSPTAQEPDRNALKKKLLDVRRQSSELERKAEADPKLYKDPEFLKTMKTLDEEYARVAKELGSSRMPQAEWEILSPKYDDVNRRIAELDARMEADSKVREDPETLAALKKLHAERGEILWEIHLSPLPETQRESLMKRLAEVYGKILAASKKIDENPALLKDEAFEKGRHLLFDEEDNLLALLASAYMDDRDSVTQDALKKHAPQLFEEAGKGTAHSVLKNLGIAEWDFRSNDRDGNRASDYWVGDVNGLQNICPMKSEGKGCQEPHWAIKLLSPSAVALADLSPLKDVPLATPPPEKPAPHWGYHFAALASYEIKGGEWKKYDDGSHRNPNRFGFCAMPAVYGKVTRFTLIIDEGGTVFRKDTGGKRPDGFPLDLVKDGWIKD